MHPTTNAMAMSYGEAGSYIAIAALATIGLIAFAGYSHVVALVIAGVLLVVFTIQDILAAVERGRWLRVLIGVFENVFAIGLYLVIVVAGSFVVFKVTGAPKFAAVLDYPPVRWVTETELLGSALRFAKEVAISIASGIVSAGAFAYVRYRKSLA